MTTLTTTELLDAKIQAERGQYFQSIFDELNYLDVDSATLASDLTNQMAFWTDFETINKDRWLKEVENELVDKTPQELAYTYDKITNDRMDAVRHRLSDIFKEHKGLRVTTEDSDNSDFPDIRIYFDEYYRADDGSYHQTAETHLYEEDQWNHDYDCSWEDMLSYAEYDG